MRKVNIFTKKGGIVLYNNELKHYGIQGMKWGVRRWQNKDGTLTSAGRKRYGRGEKMDVNDLNDSKTTRKVKKDYNELSDRDFSNKYRTTKNVYRKRVNKYGDPYMNSPLARKGKQLTKQLRLSVKAQDYRETIPLGKKIAKELLLGDFSRRTYDMARSMGVERGEAFVRSVFDIGFGIGDMAPSLYRSELSSKLSSKEPTNKIVAKNSNKKRTDKRSSTKDRITRNDIREIIGNEQTPHKLSLADIDDPDLIELNIDDPEFRAEYNVTDEQYKRYKKKYG